LIRVPEAADAEIEKAIETLERAQEGDVRAGLVL
jgi:hypothetical protein